MTPTRGYDTRIIRLGRPQRLPKHVRPWFGDSWGHWEGNTLVVETTNIHPDHGPREQTDKILQSEDAKAIERFTRIDDDTILYEYACHEGNYALSNVLSGARYQERQAGRQIP